MKHIHWQYLFARQEPTILHIITVVRVGQVERMLAENEMCNENHVQF